MAVSLYQIKKWTRKYILKTQTGFRQGVGQIYSKDEVKGYYIDLREKVLEGQALAPEELPRSRMDSGETFIFSIGVMQYGLACYDLYLMNDDEKMKQKLLVCADWAVENQKENGAWETFGHIYPEHSYSAMAQGEGVSMLLRAYIASGERKYLESAKRAVFFMLVPKQEGGVCHCTETDLVFYEYTERPAVLNGWIFALWGLFDYAKVTGDSVIQAAYEKTVDTLERYIPHYDLGYWTRYDYSDRIASPQYHKLHIDQFVTMYDLTGREIFKLYQEKFEKYRDSRWCRNKAFFIKAAQKLRGK